MKRISLFICVLYLTWGCKSSAPVTNQVSVVELTIKNVSGTYRIDTVRIEAKRIAQTQATLTIGPVNQYTEEADFTLSYVSENGEVITNTAQVVVREVQAGLVFFFYPYVSETYPHERGVNFFATGKQNEIVGGLPTKNGQTIVFVAKR
jgi:hypothetical protein